MFLKTQTKLTRPELLLEFKDRWIFTKEGGIYVRYYRLHLGILQWIAGPPLDLKIWALALAELARSLKLRLYPEGEKGTRHFFLRWLSRLLPLREPANTSPYAPLLPSASWEAFLSALRGDYDLFFLSGQEFLDPGFPYRMELQGILEREVLSRGRSFLFFSSRLPEAECPWDERYLIELSVLHPEGEELRRLPLT